jgi:HEAT repeat protein
MGTFGKSMRPDVEQMKEERDVDALIAALGDASRDVREDAVEALSRVHDRGVAGAVTGALIAALKDADGMVRASAVIGLGPRSGDPRVVEALIAALKDEFFMVRQFAATTLGAVGDPRAVGALRSAMAAEEFPDARVAMDQSIRALATEA